MKQVAIIVGILILGSCTTTTFYSDVRPSDEYAEATETYFLDGNAISVFSGESSVLEYQFIVNEGFPQLNINLLNTSDESIDFFPHDAHLEIEIDGGRHTLLFVGSDEPKGYAAAFAQETVRAGRASYGLPYYLPGNSFQTFYHNQAQTANANAAFNNAQSNLDAIARQQRDGVADQIDSFLVGRTTVRPDTAVQGGVGFVQDVTWAIGPVIPFDFVEERERSLAGLSREEFSAIQQGITAARVRIRFGSDEYVIPLEIETENETTVDGGKTGATIMLGTLILGPIIGLIIIL